MKVSEVFCKNIESTFVSCCFIILHQDFVCHSKRPSVLVFSRSIPTCITAACDYWFNPVFYFANQAFIVKKICQGNQTIEEIWASLPGFSITSPPGRIDQVGPEIIKISRETCRLIL